MGWHLIRIAGQAVESFADMAQATKFLEHNTRMLPEAAAASHHLTPRSQIVRWIREAEAHGDWERARRLRLRWSKYVGSRLNEEHWDTQWDQHHWAQEHWSMWE